MSKVYLKKKIAQRIANGHPWIFNNEVEKVEGEISGGETVEVFTHDKTNTCPSANPAKDR
jgi:23S rRNA (cytosine1962-C5)-methyltransferase